MELFFNVDHDTDEVTILVNDAITVSVLKVDSTNYQYKNISKLEDELDDDKLVEKIKSFSRFLLSQID